MFVATLGIFWVSMADLFSLVLKLFAILALNGRVVTYRYFLNYAGDFKSRRVSERVCLQLFVRVEFASKAFRVNADSLFCVAF